MMVVNNKKMKILSFFISVILLFFGYFDYKYEIFNYEYNEFFLQILFCFKFFIRFGDYFSWLSYYIFPFLEESIAFIIGQVLFLPVLWGLIYGILFIIKTIYSKCNKIKSSQ
jgi:hypothetical protein